MEWKHWTVAAVLGTTLVTVGCSQGVADTGHHDEDDSYKRSGWLQLVSRDDDRRTRLVTADNPTYRDECGSCHLAYPPGLLNAGDWRRVFTDLADHFDDNASLDPETQAELRNFTIANAATHRGSVTVGDGTPRITATRWFAREHDEMPARLVAGNPEVGSYANCAACHARAAAGSFREREIVIPGYGRWDD